MNNIRISKLIGALRLNENLSYEGDKTLDSIKFEVDMLVQTGNKNSTEWIPFDFEDIKSRPTEYGKYLICRKDGKIHWETWNGSGWAYNHNEVRFWAKIINPITGK